MEEDEQPSLRKGWWNVGGLTGFPKCLAISGKAFHVLALLSLPCETQEALFNVAPWGPRSFRGRAGSCPRAAPYGDGECCGPGLTAALASRSPACKDVPGPGAMAIGVACAVEGVSPESAVRVCLRFSLQPTGVWCDAGGEGDTLRPKTRLPRLLSDSLPANYEVSLSSRPRRPAWVLQNSMR